MSLPSPRTLPPELLDRDRLTELLDLLRDGGTAGWTADLSAVPRLATPVLQVLTAAVRHGVRLHLTGLSPTATGTLRILGLDAVLRVEGATA